MAAMEQLTGKSVLSSQFKGEEWIADLIYFEGPLLSLYRGPKGNDVLTLWVDCDKRRNRWASFEVGRDQIANYLAGFISLRGLIESQEEILFFHTSSGSRRNGPVMVKRADFPVSYLPDKDSYWNQKLGTEDAFSLISEGIEKYNLGLDGENWYVEDLSRALGFYRQLYAFHYALRNRFRSTIRAAVAKSLSRLAWKGGFSTVMWYNSLHSITPSMHRLRVKEMRYASPGHITLEVLPSVAGDVAKALSLLEDSDDREGIHAIYTETYDFFRRHGLTSIDARELSALTDANKRQMESDGVFEGIRMRLDQLLSAYGLSYAKRDLVAAGAEDLGLLKAMLSYHRRVLQLAKYLDDGSLSIKAP